MVYVFFCGEFSSFYNYPVILSKKEIFNKKTLWKAIYDDSIFDSQLILRYILRLICIIHIEFQNVNGYVNSVLGHGCGLPMAGR